MTEIFRRFFRPIQYIISDIVGDKDDTEENSTRRASDDHNRSTGQHSLPNSPSTSSVPHLGVHHALIIYHENDHEEVLRLQERLNRMVLTSGQRVSVVTEDDIVPAGQVETAAFNTYFSQSDLFLLFITEPFIRSNIHKWKSDVGLTVSLAYGSPIHRECFVIPIFTEDKTTASYLEGDHILQALAGIKYHGCEWTERTKKAFERNLEQAETRISLLRNGSSVDPT